MEAGNDRQCPQARRRGVVPGYDPEIWSGNYAKALPVSLHLFELSAILPVVFYMFRFGQRRGTGNFLNTFGSESGTRNQKRRSATIERVSEKLACAEELEGFYGEAERAILGDLLLCFCLENAKHSLGREEQIQRVVPAHYMSSWIDLPQNASNLRHVPEMIVAMLADQKGEHVEPSEDESRTWFPVGKGYENNVLIRAFSQGVGRCGDVLEDLRSDRFNEGDESVGLDQLLMIRLAQQLQAAPGRMRGMEGHRISNQRPIAESAARDFPKIYAVSCAPMRMPYLGTRWRKCWNPVSRSAWLPFLPVPLKFCCDGPTQVKSRTGRISHRRSYSWTAPTVSIETSGREPNSPWTISCVGWSAFPSF